MFDLLEWRRVEAMISKEISAALSDAHVAALWRAANVAVHVIYVSCAQQDMSASCSHTEDEHLLMFLGCRTLTNGLAAVRLLSAGYYGPSMALVRDSLETTMLLKLFRERPDEIQRWRDADPVTRLNDFRPKKLAGKLTASNVWHRHEEYQELSELAGHPTPQNAALAFSSARRRRMVGAFFDERTAGNVLLEITLALCDACYEILGALCLAERFESEWKEIEEAIDQWNSAGP
jgi:hypothetical protein